MSTDSRVSWLRLARLPGVGPILIKRLLAALGSPEAILTAHPGSLAEVEGIGMHRANQIVSGAKETEAPAREELERIEVDGLMLLTPDDAAFPPGLRNIPDPPVCLYVRGRIVPTDAVAVGIVGARQCSTYGREQAHRFAAQLAEAGLTIISGGARGIDTAAHAGALQVKGRTLVIQGCGLRNTYPPENKGLYARIVAEGAGAIISELPLDAPPAAENFPPRNRIIAGMSLGILVVEANMRSGSLITARLAAADYGREVFALPGPVTAPSSAGTHHLIKTGTAHLVDSPEDILANLGEVGALLQNAAKQTIENTEHDGEVEIQRTLQFQRPDSHRAASVPPGSSVVGSRPVRPAFTSTQQTILAALTAEGLSIDDLIEATALHPSVLMAELTILQIQSAVTRLPANRFAKKS